MLRERKNPLVVLSEGAVQARVPARSRIISQSNPLRDKARGAEVVMDER